MDTEDVMLLGPAAVYRHDHPPVINVNVEYEKRLTLGQRVSDRVAEMVGSWPFIITQSVLLAAWIALNAYLSATGKSIGRLKAWDPYPFILLNLMLSFQAAYTGPVVMMSQNRQSEKDRMTSQHDFDIDRKAEEEIQVLMEHLLHQDKIIIETLRRVEILQETVNERGK